MVLPELNFWIDFLSSSTNPRELKRRGGSQDIGISVDTSTDWDVGLCWGRRWAAWRVVSWAGAYRNIRWLEGVAVEFVVYILERMVFMIAAFSFTLTTRVSLQLSDVVIVTTWR